MTVAKLTACLTRCHPEARVVYSNREIDEKIEVGVVNEKDKGHLSPPTWRYAVELR